LVTILFGIVIALFIGGCGETSTTVDKWELTYSTEFGRVPRWSPDGERILFGDDRVGSPGLYIWTPGEDPQLLADSLPNHKWDYDWSPDGGKVGFTSPGEPGSQTAGVWIVDIDDGSRTRPLDRGRDLSWYYDSSTVAVRIDNPEGGFPGIYLVDIDSGELEFIADGYMPVCSPVDSRIAYNESEINGKLFLIDAELEPLAVSDVGAYKWVWTADGSSIFCAINDYTTGTLRWDIVRIIKPENDWLVENIAEWAQYPAPDRTGSRVAFMRISNASWRGLWLYTIGKGDDRIADYGQNPDFNPHSDMIAVNSTEGGIRVLVK